MNLRSNFGLLLVTLSFPFTYTNAEFRGGGSTSSSSVNTEDKSYVVAIYKGDDYVCGGALITSEYVVTASECLKNDGRATTVKAGVKGMPQKEEVRDADTSICPTDKENNDMFIGIIKVAPSFPSTVGTIKLCSTELKSGKSMEWYSRLKNVIHSTVETIPRTSVVSSYCYNGEITQYWGFAVTSEVNSGEPGFIGGALCAVVGVGPSSRFYINLSKGSPAFGYIEEFMKTYT